MGVKQINLDDSTERKCTKYGLAHQIPPDFSVRHIVAYSKWAKIAIFGLLFDKSGFF